MKKQNKFVEKLTLELIEQEIKNKITQKKSKKKLFQ